MATLAADHSAMRVGDEHFGGADEHRPMQPRIGQIDRET